MGWPRLAGISILTVALLIVTGYALLPLGVAGFTAGIDFLLNAGLSLASVGGGDPSAILLAIARETFSVLASTNALGVIAALVIVSAVALYGLQRLLGLEEESNAN
jgi:hypothetical protein